MTTSQVVAAIVSANHRLRKRVGRRKEGVLEGSAYQGRSLSDLERKARKTRESEKKVYIAYEKDT